MTTNQSQSKRQRGVPFSSPSEPVIDDDDADCVHTAIVVSGARAGANRWLALLATECIVRDGPNRFYCRGRVTCPGYTKSLANDSGTGSTNAFMHMLLCCPERMSKELLLEAVTKDRKHLRDTIAKWVLRPPPSVSGLPAFLKAKAHELSASSSCTVRPDMTFSQKLAAVGRVVASGIAASGVPLNAASSDLVGSIILAFDPTCPIPSPDMVARLIPGVLKEAVSLKCKMLERVAADTPVPLDFSLAWDWDMWSGDKLAESDNGFATSSLRFIDSAHELRPSFLNIQHIAGRHDAAQISVSIDELFEHPWGSDGSAIDPLLQGIATSDEGSNGKAFFLKEYQVRQRARLKGLPHEHTLAMKDANDAKRELVSFWQPCACHRVENVVKQDVLNPSSASYHEVVVVGDAIKLLWSLRRTSEAVPASPRSSASLQSFPHSRLPARGSCSSVRCPAAVPQQRFSLISAPLPPQLFPRSAKHDGTRTLTS